jgi:hypothetical protein
MRKKGVKLPFTFYLFSRGKSRAPFRSFVGKKKLTLLGVDWCPLQKIEVRFRLSVCVTKPINYNSQLQMSITIKQLEELAREYRFDVDEARRFLGKEPKKRGRPAKKDADSDEETPRKASSSAAKKSPKAKEEKPAAAKRGPSGYNLFVKNQGVAITEAAKQWKNLSDSARDKWNTKAKAMK